MTIAHKLAGIMLSEVSVVDVPANAGASIAIWKRGEMEDQMDMTPEQKGRMKKLMADGMSEADAVKAAMTETAKGGSTMDPKELAKQVEALTAQVADLNKSAATATANETAIVKAAQDAGFTVAKTDKGVTVTKAADPEYVEINGQKVEKSSVPAPLLEMVLKQGTELAKMRAEKHEAELAKRGATELPNLAGTDLVKGKMLAAAGDDPAMLTALKAADAAMAKSMQELGQNPLADEGSPTFKLDKMARTHAAEKGVSFEVAYAAVTATGDGAALYKSAMAESN
jgi:hypothetical protein